MTKSKAGVLIFMTNDRISSIDKLLRGMFLSCLMKLFFVSVFVMLGLHQGLLCLGGGVGARNCIDYPRTSRDSQVYQNAFGDFFVGDQKHLKKFPKNPKISEGDPINSEDFQRLREVAKYFR